MHNMADFLLHDNPWELHNGGHLVFACNDLELTIILDRQKKVSPDDAQYG